ncbi:MAG: hypothetical protein ACOX7Q_16670 [Kiritimatiellia bacterium]
MQNQRVYAEGLAPSPGPWADALVWHWTETVYDDHATWQRHHYATNRVTVLGVALMPDADSDGAVASALPGAPDHAVLVLSSNRTWHVGVASNTLKKVRLSAYVGAGVPGTLRLHASGTARFRVWPGPTSTNGTPLLSLTGSPDGVSDYDFPDRFTDLEVYAEFLGPGDAELTFEFYGPKYDRRHRFRAEATQKIVAWEIGLHSVSLDAQGMPLFEGGRPVLGGLIPPEASLSTYVPYDGGGAPNLVSTSPRWVTFAAVTNAVTNSAVLSMTQEHAEGFKVWELDFGGATTNGTFAWQWQGASNDFLRAEIPTNAAGATMPLALAYIDAGFDGQTNEVQEAYSLYRHDDTNGFWGSTYSITGPREEIGMPAFSAHNAFIVRVPPEAAFAEGTELVCRLLPEGEEDDAIEAEMERQADGSYVTSLIVPAPEADGGAGLEGWDDARVLNIKDGTVKMVRVEVYNSLLSSGRKITDKKIPVQQAALFSALVSVEEAAGMRVSLGVNAAGEAARAQAEIRRDTPALADRRAARRPPDEAQRVDSQRAREPHKRASRGT